MKKRMHPAVMVKILLIIGICAFSLFPIMWCLSTSLKPESQIYEVPPRWIPREVTWVHYGQILRDSNMLHYFKNTVILATGNHVDHHDGERAGGLRVFTVQVHGQPLSDLDDFICKSSAAGSGDHTLLYHS